MSAIDQRLAAGEVVILDGGMGTELQAQGVPMDHDAWCGLANLDHQDVVRSIHEEYIRAGADVIITNTYPTNRFALGAGGYGDRVEEANAKAVEAAVQARENAAERPVAIAGSLSVWGIRDAREHGLIGEGDDDILAGYREQATILAEGGVDLIVLEMFGTTWLPGLQAAAETGLPVWIGPMVDEDGDGRVWTRPSAAPLEEALPELLGPAVSAVTLMHSEVEPIVPALEVVKRLWDGPFGAYPHVGDFQRPRWVFGDVTPEGFAAEARRWVDLGAQLVGGCCGIRPEHIRALREELPTHVPDGAGRS
jgi:S-methylmethionine-dependent homocysteine/selenocysteine methylase